MVLQQSINTQEHSEFVQSSFGARLKIFLSFDTYENRCMLDSSYYAAFQG